MLGVALMLEEEEEVYAVVEEAISMDNNYIFGSSRAALRNLVY